MAGRKHDLIVRIAFKRNIKGMPWDKTIESIKNYRRKTVAELQSLLNEEFKSEVDAATEIEATLDRAEHDPTEKK